MRVAVLDDYQQAARAFGDWSGLPAGAELVTFSDHFDDPDALTTALAGFDVVVAMRERTAFPEPVLTALGDLRLLVTTGMRNAVIDVDAAVAAGITVCGTSGVGTPTAELTWGLILALARHIPSEDAGIRAGGWQATVGTGLAHKTLGVVGLGHLGRQVAEIGRAFRMRVVSWSQNLTAERAEAAGAELVTKEELFSTADVVTVHLVLSERTHHLVGASELRAMKPTAIVINTSRWPIVDHDALVLALTEGWIAGAGIDVFTTEPLPLDDPLRSAPNTVLTPHLGYVTDDCYEVFYRDIVEDIVRFAAGDPVRVLPPRKGA